MRIHVEIITREMKISKPNNIVSVQKFHVTKPLRVLPCRMTPPPPLPMFTHLLSMFTHLLTMFTHLISMFTHLFVFCAFFLS